MASLKIFQYNRITVELLVQDTIQYMVNTFGQNQTTFTVASAYGQILFVLEQLAQLILFYIEDSVTELNINTAIRDTSVQGLAGLAGHDITRAIAATGSINLASINPSNQVAGAIVVVANGTRLQCQNNGLTYMLDLPGDEVRLPTGTNVSAVSLNIVQGQMQTVTFTGTGKNYQSFSVNSTQGSLIDMYRVDVFVNGQKWQAYDSFMDMPYNGNTFRVRTALVSGGIDIAFGNTYMGAIPPLGSTITVEYLVTNGDLGNLVLADGETAFFTWTDSGFDIYGNEIDLNAQFQVNLTIAPGFGSPPEPLVLTRLLAPRTSRNFVLATADNYVIFFEKFNQFSIIDVYTNTSNLPGASSEDQRITYVFLVPDVSKTMLSNQNYFNVPENNFILTTTQQQKIMALINDSGQQIMTTELSFVQPVVSRFVLNIALIIFQGAGYPSQDVIIQTILSSLSTYFINIRRRDRIPRSDLITIIESVPGVDSVNLTAVSELDEKAISLNPNATPQYTDQFGDLLIANPNEIVLIRGGWSDRRGLYYQPGIDPNNPCCVNIVVNQVVSQTYNSMVNNNTVSTIVNNNQLNTPTS